MSAENQLVELLELCLYLNQLRWISKPCISGQVFYGCRLWEEIVRVNCMVEKI